MEVCIHCEEEVEFETDRDGDLICTSCGWSQSAQVRPSRWAKRYDGPAKPAVARVAAGLLLVQGLLALGSFIGLLDLWLAIGVFRLKENHRSYAVALAILQLVIAGIVVVVFSTVAYFEPLLAMWAHGFLAVLPFWVLIKICTIAMLTRRSVKAAFID